MATEDANLDALNLAQVLVDDNKIIVPLLMEGDESEESEYITSLVIAPAAGGNTAGKE